MGLKSLLSKPVAQLVDRLYLEPRRRNPARYQKRDFSRLIKGGRNTRFGEEHRFDEIQNYEDYKQRVPIREYETFKPYIDKVVAGEENVLWPGRPLYFCKTSGTTSGAKYIPISKESMPNHVGSARNALLSYIAETGDSKFVDGKMIFLQGSPDLQDTNGIPTGRLSGIVAHHVPGYLLKNRLPSFKTNRIEDWEEKVEAIVDETLNADMRLISGIPSWVQFYFERLKERTGGKKIGEIFPHFGLFVYGGVNYAPYRSRFKELIGKDLPSIETYPASEGFIAFEDRQSEDGLLLVVGDGIFYEFIPSEEYHSENPTRLSLEQVETGVNYALIINSNAGLYGYSIGDTVKFVSKNPHRLVVTGRVKHFISAFGEHVIAEEVEKAMKEALEKHGGELIDFSLAPQINPSAGLPYHEWFVSFSKPPSNLSEFAKTLDASLQRQNTYYKDLIDGNILRPAQLTILQEDAFNQYMKSVGKLGAQHKLPRLSNDRKIADQLSKWKK